MEPLEGTGELGGLRRRSERPIVHCKDDACWWPTSFLEPIPILSRGVADTDLAVSRLTIVAQSFV
jgi:hypothetical protein